MKQKGIHAVNSTTTLFARIKENSRKLATTQLAIANVSQIQTVGCDFYGEGHVNGNFTIKVESFEAQYANF